jgi:translation initiation factor IF-1
MKIAEALNERKDLQVKLTQLKNQMKANVMIQEGDKVTANPEEVIAQYSDANKRLAHIITKINKLNTVTYLVHMPELTLTQAIENREELRRQYDLVNSAIKTGEESTRMYSRSEIKMVRTIDLPKYHKLRDSLGKSIREYDTAIQETNWVTEIEL